MNYGLTEDQAMILEALEQLLIAKTPTPPVDPLRFQYAAELDHAVAEAGYIDIAREPDYGALEAALVVERIARQPCVVEAAASALIAPALGLPAGTRPIALAQSDARNPSRFLPMASVLVVERGDKAVLFHVDPDNVQPTDTLFAYPYGTLKTLNGVREEVVGNARTLRRAWRLALAAEAAGCMASALSVVVDHVKTRYAFGRPLGAFQSIQHRLAMAAETAASTKWLALRAAWSGSEGDAAIAAGFAQSRIAQFTYDLHQFSGAMGLTLEFPLHLWTYRLRALAGELGGSSAQRRAAGAAIWTDAA